MVELKDLNMARRDITPEQRRNLLDLSKKLTILENKYGILFKITRGFSTPEDQIHIYNLKGIFDPDKIPMHSAHLEGNAADIYDPNRLLEFWLASDKGTKALIDVDLYRETYDGSPHVHLQQVAPKSGHRVFVG